jgi:hypothetical protein
MLRFLPFFLFLILGLARLPAQNDDSLPISITSPDTATTFAFGTIKNHALIWNNATHMLMAEVTFVDEQQGLVQSGDDTHRFRLPGITYDKAKGIFYATSATGEVIPVAHKKKTLFITSIEPLPNAAVRIFHHRGDVSVKLEAIRPSDLAKQKQEAADPDGTHSIDLQSLLP